MCDVNTSLGREMREFRSPKALLYVAGGLGALTLITMVLAAWAVLLLWTPTPLLTGVCYLAVMWLFGAVPALYLINLYPSIQRTDEGLTISYNVVQHIAIPWADIVDVRDPLMPGYGTYVYAQSLTPCHRLYGGWLRPAFLIASDIPNRDTLIAEIRWHVAMRP